MIAKFFLKQMPIFGSKNAVFSLMTHSRAFLGGNFWEAGGSQNCDLGKVKHAKAKSRFNCDFQKWCKSQGPAERKDANLCRSNEKVWPQENQGWIGLCRWIGLGGWIHQPEVLKNKY